MLTIIFAKTKISDIHEFLCNPSLRAVKSFGQINNDTIFAALTYSDDLPTLIEEATGVAELIKIHPAFCSGTMTAQPVRSKNPEQRTKRLRCERKKKNKAHLNPKNWTRFIKYKHIRDAYFQSLSVH